MSDHYPLRDNPAAVAFLEQRTAAGEAGFLLPDLRPGMRVLDCGSGPGTITLGLAEAVAPGEVVGVDLQPAMVEAARALAAARGVSNARFAVGDVYRLPFADGAFDAAFARGVLIYLREPVRALAEMRRVLRPGGVAGLRDRDEGTRMLAPSSPLLDRLHALEMRLLRHQGGNPEYARHQRRLLLEAGYTRAEASFVAAGAGTPEATRQWAAGLAARLEGPVALETILGRGWCDPAALDTMLEAMRRWGERPDAAYAVIHCSALGWR